MAHLPHDLFDRCATLGPGKNSGVDFFAAQIALVLKLLRGGEQCPIDERRSERGSYAAHRFAHGTEEGGAGVFHQAARARVPLPEVMQQSRHWSVQRAARYYNEGEIAQGRAARLA